MSKQDGNEVPSINLSFQTEGFFFGGGGLVFFLFYICQPIFTRRSSNTDILSWPMHTRYPLVSVKGAQAFNVQAMSTRRGQYQTN